MKFSRSDFEMQRFESRRPSQRVRSLRVNKRISLKRPARLAAGAFGQRGSSAALTLVILAGSRPAATKTTQEFVIKYGVPGEEHWDNNGGTNYKIGAFVGAVGGNVMLRKATSHIGHEAGGGFTFTTSWFDGEIYVQNLSFNKRVGVHYTADDGATWHDADGSYAGKVQAVANVVDSVEIWKFKTPTLNLVNPAQFRFAVYY